MVETCEITTSLFFGIEEMPKILMDPDNPKVRSANYRSKSMYFQYNCYSAREESFAGIDKRDIWIVAIHKINSFCQIIVRFEWIYTRIEYENVPSRGE